MNTISHWVLGVGELAQQDLPVPGAVDPGGQFPRQRALGGAGRAEQQAVLARQDRGHQRPHDRGAFQELPGDLVGDRLKPLRRGEGGGRVLAVLHGRCFSLR